jgi:hypothetical protein
VPCVLTVVDLLGPDVAVTCSKTPHMQQATSGIHTGTKAPARLVYILFMPESRISSVQAWPGRPTVMVCVDVCRGCFMYVCVPGAAKASLRG